MAPSGAVLLRGGSRFVNPFVYCNSESEISQCDVRTLSIVSLNVTLSINEPQHNAMLNAY